MRFLGLRRPLLIYLNDTIDKIYVIYKNCHYDFYGLQRDIPIEEVVLQPGETDDAKWVTFHQVHEMIEAGQVCKIIAHQFLRQERDLWARQTD